MGIIFHNDVIQELFFPLSFTSLLAFIGKVWIVSFIIT